MRRNHRRTFVARRKSPKASALAKKPSLGSGAHAYAQGYRSGYERGKEEGYEAFSRKFEGTSIIIPSYNQKELLLQCLDSIEAHTASPYEIIVVDDGSTDGTSQALSRRSLRLAVHQVNGGFARAVNTGLRMAQGQTIVILNNDTLVTSGWLSNMLACLQQSPDIGAVGPVTNYIGGEQLVQVPYENLEDMWKFAAAYNVPDQARWRETDRLVGFCLLMRREVLEDTGFFDEGYRVGNFEDDDWGIRLRIFGRRLMIAGDAFIHHFGSVSMKSLDEKKLLKVNEDNESYFNRKWGNPHILMDQLKDSGSYSSTQFYPVHTVLKSSQGHLYWLEDEGRYLINGTEPHSDIAARAVRISQRELRRFPLVGEISSEQAWLRVQDLLMKQMQPGESMKDGTVLRTEQGQIYQLARGQLRRFVTAYAAQAWRLQDLVIDVDSNLLADYPEGLPILAPTLLISEEL